MVEVALTHVHLQVADHVEEHKAQQTNSGNSHDVLLANGCSIQINQERLALTSCSFDCGSGDRTPLHHCLRHRDLRLSKTDAVHRTMNPLRRYPHDALHPEINGRKTRAVANRHKARTRRISKFPVSNGVSCRTHGCEFSTIHSPLVGGHPGCLHRVPRS